MKKMLALVLSAVMIFTFSVPASAHELSAGSTENIITLPDCPVGARVKIPVGDAEYIVNGAGQLIKISDLISFASQEEADSYIEMMKEQLSVTTQYNPTINFNARATHGDGLVASKKVGVAGTIKLRVAYTTSGDSNTGTITYHEAYTTFSGFTYSFEWNEKLCTSQVTSSGKDIYARAVGELVFYFLVDGLIELGRDSVDLSGYCSAIH